MKKSTLTLLLLLIILTLMSCTLFISSDILVQPAASFVEQFTTLYIDINLKQSFQNPYDPEDMSVAAIISLLNGETLILPRFYKALFQKKSEGEARFTAKQPGTHSYYIQSISLCDTLYSKFFFWDLRASNHDGFLKLNPNSFYSFMFDCAKRFRGVGMNLGWENQSEWKYPYETYLDESEKKHANFFRTWMCPWDLPLEWTTIKSYETFADDLENWDKTFSHSVGLALNFCKTQFTEDDTNRLTFQSDSTETIIYHLKIGRRFKIKSVPFKRLPAKWRKIYRSLDQIF